jgi:hypothetical protein
MKDSLLRFVLGDKEYNRLSDADKQRYKRYITFLGVIKSFLIGFFIKEGTVTSIVKLGGKLYMGGYQLSDNHDVDHRGIEAVGKASARRVRMLRNPNYYD